MTEAPITIITCFSYPDTRKFIFNPVHLRSDLRRVLAFAHNKVGSSFQDIYVLTDIKPDPQIRDKILRDFQEQVIFSLRRRGLPRPSSIGRLRPLEWLQRIVGDKLAYEIIREIMPAIHISTSVEFASLFTNFSLICGNKDYDDSLIAIFKRPMKNLFFYYSGHGVKTLDHTGHDLGLVIPDRFGGTQFYPRVRVQECFKHYLSSVHLLVIFDCCYGENFLEQPYRWDFSERRNRVLESSHTGEHEVICLSGTRSNQTCGFYSDQRESSSLYTYYLVRCLNEISEEIKNGVDNRDLSRLYHEVELRVQEYRSRTGKTPQNMLIGLSNPDINRFPKWLFRRSFNGEKETLVEGI